MILETVKGAPVSVMAHVQSRVEQKKVKKGNATNGVMVFCYQNCSSAQEKLLKFEAEGRQFTKFLRSLEQFIQTVKGQNNFW